MKVYEALAAAFQAEGTTAVFDLMGDANMHWLNALDRLGVGIYDVRHEGAGLAMADGWARLSGEPGVCSTTSGPGYTQLATTMVVASRARTPLVAFCGDTATGDEDDAQRFDHARFGAAIEAGFVRVVSADTAQHAVQRAFYLARLESRPVILSVPLDVQHLDLPDDEPYVPSTALLDVSPVAPDPERIRTAVDIIQASERPVVLVGRGAMQADARQAVLELAARIGGLLATTLLAKNWLSGAEFNAGISGLYATKVATELFQEADCVVAVGASLNHYTTEHGYLYPNARHVWLDLARHRTLSDGRSADCYVQCDARAGVERLNALLDDRSFRSPGYRTDDVRRRLADAYADPAEFDVQPGTVDPRDACRVLDETIPEDVALVLGSGQQIRFPTMLMQRPRPYVLAQHHFGCIGQGLTVAMGAVVASGMRPAFLLEGDGGFMMHLAEFETAVRYRLPLLAVVMNDQQLGAEYHKSVAIGLDGELARIPTPDLGAVGTALGGRGAVVRTIEELKAAAETFVAAPAPTLLDVRISPNVLSIPYRRLFYGLDV